MMTSNLGASYLNESQAEGPVPPEVATKVHGAIAGHFPPEFINRIDGIILYRRLTRDDLKGIVKLRLHEIQERLNKNGKKIKLLVDETAEDHLAATGYSATMGARPLARTIQAEILNPLSRLLLQNRVREGEKVSVTADVKHNRLVVIPNHDADVEMADDADDSDDDDDEADEMIVEELD